MQNLITKRSISIKRTAFNGNRRLVVYVAKKYADRGIPLLDLIQEESLGLMKSIGNDKQSIC